MICPRKFKLSQTTTVSVRYSSHWKNKIKSSCGGLLCTTGCHIVWKSKCRRMSVVRASRAQRLCSTYPTFIVKCCRWQGKFAEMMEAHNMAPRKVWYRLSRIDFRTVPIPPDTIERGLIIGFALVNDTIDNIFCRGVAGIRQEWIFLVGCAAISRAL